MPEKKQPITNLNQLLDVDILKMISAEIQLEQVLPGWIYKATSVKLKNVLQRYLDFIREHKAKLESSLANRMIISGTQFNRVMNSFIEETREKLGDCVDQEVHDVCLLAGIQEINHYKISVYGTSAAFSKALGMEKQAEVFHELEVNEKQIDDRLSQLAEFEINEKAKAPIALPGK
ncbi:MAG TPA: DUF892 family protein [Chitinophagaceae bacterium]|nr:DUF892 family protein [Chitinophagaceae bacterium]